MQHIVNPFAGLLAISQLANIAFNKLEVGPLRRAYQGLHFIEVVLEAGFKIVEPNDLLVQPEQDLQKIGANEAGSPCDQPNGGWRHKTVQEGFVSSHECSVFNIGLRFLHKPCGYYFHKFSNYRRKSLALAGSRYFRSNSTCSGLPKARSAGAPMDLK